MCLIIVLFSFKTISRNIDWRNNITLHTIDANTATNSARAHYYLGNQMATILPNLNNIEKKKYYITTGIQELKKAISILPDYSEAYYSIGEIFSSIGNYDSACYYFFEAVKLDTMNARFQNNYGDMLFKLKKFNEAKNRFQLAVNLDTTYSQAYCNFGSGLAMLGQQFLDSVNISKMKNDEKERIYYLKTAIAYLDTSIYNFNKSIILEPDFYLPYYLLGYVYHLKGDEKSSQYYYAFSEEIKQKEELRNRRKIKYF